MTLGVIMLVHTRFDRAEQMVRHWTAAGCPVVLHVDKAVSQAENDAFRAALSSLPNVRFAPRHTCEWGMWGMVAASQAAATLMLEEFPNVSHIFLASGSC